MNEQIPLDLAQDLYVLQGRLARLERRLVRLRIWLVTVALTLFGVMPIITLWLARARWHLVP